MSGGDERGVSPVVGFVILFGVFTIAMTVWQVQIVPSQNAQTEFEHHQTVTTDLVGVNNALVAATGGEKRTPRVDLGTRYTERTIFVNPPPATGRLRTTAERDGVSMTVRLDNVTTAEDAPAGADSIWNGTERTYQSAALVYNPRYYSYEGPDAVVSEHGMLYSEFGDRRVTHSEHSVVSGDEITLPLLEEGVSESSLERESLAVEPVTPSARSVPVESTAADPITITLSSPSPDTLAKQINDSENVADVTADTSNVTVELEPGTYDLQLSRLGIDGQATEDPKPSYTAVVDGHNATIASGTTRDLTVEVRTDTDEAVANETVTLDLDGDDGLLGVDNPSKTNITATTDERGRLEAVYEAGAPGTVTINATHGGAESATATITVTSGSGPAGMTWNKSGPVSVSLGEFPTSLTAEDGAGLNGTPVGFATENSSILTNTSSDSSTTDGEATATFDTGSEAEAGDRAYVYVWNYRGGDRLEIRIEA